jgi:hypothetical protein
MITDDKLVLQGGTTADTTFSATGVSSNYIAVSNQAPDLGAGESLTAHILVTTAATAGTANDSSTVEFRIVSSAASDSTTKTLTNDTDFTDAQVSSEAVFTMANHGLHTGHVVLTDANAATLPTGLTTARYYVVIRLTADTFQLASSMANAFAGTAVATDVGSGAYRFVVQPMILASSGAVWHPVLSVGTALQLIVPPAMTYGPYTVPLLPYVLGQYVEGGTITGGRWRVQLIKNAHGIKFHASGFSIS